MELRDNDDCIKFANEPRSKSNLGKIVRETVIPVAISAGVLTGLGFAAKYALGSEEPVSQEQQEIIDNYNYENSLIEADVPITYLESSDGTIIAVPTADYQKEESEYSLE